MEGVSLQGKRQYGVPQLAFRPGVAPGLDHDVLATLVKVRHRCGLPGRRAVASPSAVSPVALSNARKRLSMVPPMKVRPLAVTIGPPKLAGPASPPSSRQGACAKQCARCQDQPPPARPKAAGAGHAERREQDLALHAVGCARLWRDFLVVEHLAALHRPVRPGSTECGARHCSC